MVVEVWRNFQKSKVLTNGESWDRQRKAAIDGVIEI